MSVEIIPVCFEDDVGSGTDLESIIVENVNLKDGDIVVVSQKIISKREGRTIRLDSVTPSLLAQGIASQYGKDPRMVELVLSESKRIVRMERGVLIVETHHGFICANAGVDESNVVRGSAVLLPVDADASARELKDRLYHMSGMSVGVLISDTFGRPFRMGQTDCVVGISGILPILDYRGTRDSKDRELRVSEEAVADEICAAAALVKGKSNGCPVSVVRNLALDDSDGSVNELLRPRDGDLFR